MRRLNVAVARRSAFVLTLSRRSFTRDGPFSPSRALRLESKYLEAAMRLTTPSTVNPATPSPDGKPPTPDDPMVVWREHYSAEHSMPYYHNLATNETTWEIPSGFCTRFPSHHKSLGNIVDANGRVWPKDGPVPNAGISAEVKPTTIPGEAEARAAVDQAKTTRVTSAPTATDQAAATAPAAEATASGPLTLKQRVTALGGAGLLLYLIIHNFSLAVVFTMMYVFGFDLIALAKSYGIVVPGTSGGSGGFLANFFVAVALNKTLVPLQLVLTIALAPRVAPMLQPAAKKFALIANVLFSRH